MKKVLLMAMLGFGFSVNAQKTSEDNTIYTTLEASPIYPGGIQAMNKFICENINVPREIPTDRKLITVFVKFVIEKDGSVSSPKIMSGVNEECDKEALNVINLFPKWQAGGMTKYGTWKPLRCYVMLPVKFFKSISDCEKSYNQSFRRN